MRYVITGGAGFIGQRLTTCLADMGHEVIVWDVRSLPSESLGRGVLFVPATTSAAEIETLLRTEDIVFHLAWRGFPGATWRSADQDVLDNVSVSLRLIEAAAAAKIRRLVFVSSGGTVYGRVDDQLVREDHPTRPISSYGVCKLTVENYVRMFSEINDFEYAIARIGNAYGPQQNTDQGLGAVGTFVQRAIRCQPITIYGEGTVVRDYIYVDDIIEALIALAQIGAPQDLFNVGTQRGVSLNDLVSIIQKLTQRPIMVHYTESRSVDVPRIVLDTTRMRTCFNWEARTPIEEGIRYLLAAEGVQFQHTA